MPTVTAHPNTDSAESVVADGPFAIEVYYDGDCPLCRREIDWLRRLDRRRRIRFTNIAAPGFQLPNGRTFDQLMAEIHARLPDGTWITGVEVFRQLYGAVCCPLLMAPTRLPGVSQLLDWGYRVFARNRLRLTGRCTENCRVPRGTDSCQLPQGSPPTSSAP